jgi:hypothetical protein
MFMRNTEPQTSMGLSEIAAEVGRTTTRQRERGVAAVERRADPETALEPFADELPCSVAAAATLLEAFVAGRTVGESAREAGVAPTTGAKALHLVGVEGVCPLGPTGRRVVRDWLAGELGRADALELTGASEREFALAAYVETHDPLDGAREAVEGALAPGGDAMVSKRDNLADVVDDPEL